MKAQKLSNFMGSLQSYDDNAKRVGRALAKAGVPMQGALRVQPA
jgi:hypothetical protein